MDVDVARATLSEKLHDLTIAIMTQHNAVLAANTPTEVTRATSDTARLLAEASAYWSQIASALGTIASH